MGDKLKENYEKLENFEQVATAAKGYLNTFTGELQRYNNGIKKCGTPGFGTRGKDMCVKSDYIPIAGLIARYTQQGIDYNEVAKEYAYEDGSGPNIDDDLLDDKLESGDDVFDTLDTMDDVNTRISAAAQQPSVSAADGAGEQGATPTPAQGEGATSEAGVGSEA